MWNTHVAGHLEEIQRSFVHQHLLDLPKLQTDALTRGVFRYSPERITLHGAVIVEVT